MKNNQHRDYVEEVEIDVLRSPYNSSTSNLNSMNFPDPHGRDSGYSRPTRDISRPGQPYHRHQEGYQSPGWSSSMTLASPGPQDSRPGTPTWQDSGRSTPLGRAVTPGHIPGFESRPSSFVQPHFPQSLDSRPNSYMHQSHASLTALLNSPPSPTFGKSSPIEGSSIAQLQDRDDSDHWNGWRRNVFYAVPFLTMLNVLLYFVYLALRVACIVFAQNKAEEVYIQAWVFVAIEVFVAVPPMMHNLWTMWALKKRGRPQLRIVGDNVPSVDVFVTCCGEEDDLVMDTVRAACDIDYPWDKFRVIILDDGKSEGLEKEAAHLALTYPNLFYIARPKYPGVPHHFKAGNLNYGLDQVHLMPGGAGQYMAALDADMIPEPAWLRALIPHLVQDPKLAMACPPQLFYNTPKSDPLAQNLDFFVHVIEPIKDAMGVAWCTGSGYVVRRDALDEIGNFPLGSLAEDVATSTKLLGRGWRTAFIHEPLQFGTVPEDYGGHLKQRTRWAIGTVDTAFKLKFCLWGEDVRQMTFAQRFSGFLYATLNLYTILLSASLFAIPIILAMGKPLVAYAELEQLRWLIRACFASFMANRLCEFALSMPAGYRTGRRGARYELWMSPYIALCIIRSFILPTWLGGQTQAFKPTGSLGSALNERDPKTRAGLFRRMFTILFGYMGIYHFIFVYFTLVAVSLTSYRCFAQETNTRDILFCLITHAFWPPLTFLFICSSLWIPIAYAIEPPSVPDREQLLIRDPKTGVAHPTPAAKKVAYGGEDAYSELEYTITTGFTALVFVASFIF